jgi:2-phosphoglycerate kinase
VRNFENIRRVQKYIKSQALSHDWPVLASYNLDQTIAAVIDMVVEKASGRLGSGEAVPEQPSLEQIEGSAPRETVS